MIMQLIMIIIIIVIIIVMEALVFLTVQNSPEIVEDVLQHFSHWRVSIIIVIVFIANKMIAV